MPNYDAIVISAATINAKCSTCRRPLDADASLNIKYGFYDKCFCPQCLMDTLSEYPKLKQDLDSTQEDLITMTKAFELMEKEISLIKEKVDGNKKESGQKTGSKAETSAQTKEAKIPKTTTPAPSS